MKYSKKLIRVAIYQPVIPKYRVPLFTALNQRPEIDIEVFASMTAPGAPSTPDLNFDFNFHSVSFTPLLKGQLAWQSGLHIPSHYDQGDVIVICGNPRYLSNYPLIVAARKKKIGIVWWGIWHYPNSKWWAIKGRKVLLHIPDVVLTYSDKEVDLLRDQGFAAHRLYATNNTIATDEIEKARDLWPPHRIQQFMNSKGISGKKIVLFCGRLTAKPQLYIAIKALKILTKNNRLYSLVIIGDGPEKENLKRYSQELNVENQIHWLGSIYEQADLAPWFLDAIALVYPGAIGLTISHAFAYGLPVITHGDAKGQPPEFYAIKNDYNGLYFKRGDSEDLAKKIEAINEGPEKRAFFCTNALKTIKERYSFNGMVNRFSQAVLAASEFAFKKE